MQVHMHTRDQNKNRKDNMFHLPFSLHFTETNIDFQFFLWFQSFLNFSF
jgi:hypothetical protein